MLCVVREWSVRCVFLLIACAPSVWTSEAWAEEPVEPDPVVQAEEVVVSATKTPLPVSQVTSAVEVITAQDMKKQNIKRVVDALQLAQGVAIFSNGGPGTEANARIRGGSSSQTLVLIDGAIVNSGTLGSYNFANLTTDNIERVEILRGAQSMLWGSDAMGGVINIVTKRGQGPLSATAFLEYGSFASLREGGTVSGKQGAVDYSLSLSRWDTSSFSAVNYRRGATERDSYRNWQGSGRIGADLPHDGRLDFTMRWMNSDVQLDSVSATSPADVYGSKNRSQEYVFSGSYEQPLTGWWSQRLTLARAQEASQFLPGTLQRNLITGAFSTPFGSPNEIRVLSNRLEWQHNFQITKLLLLSAGYQFREQQGENDTGLTNRILSSHAGFAQAQFNLWDRVFATAGIRQDNYNVFGEATTYRLTAGYFHKETDTKLRAGYSTGFRAPSMNELYFPNFGNSNLGPEKNQSMDMGVDQYFFSKQLKLTGGFFWNRYRNLIVTTFDPVFCAPFSTFGFCPQQLGDASTKGWEAGLSYTYSSDRPFLKSVILQAQYTNTLTRDLETQSRLPRWPTDQWSASVSYQPIDPLWITVIGRYVGSRFNTAGDRQPLPAFDVWSLAVTYDVTKQMQAYLRAENLFNEKYEEIASAGTPIRSIFGGLRFTLGGKA